MRHTMKVLTIQEPYATFIMQGLKKIETRSWKTNYRGEIYIHAGKSKQFLKTIDNEQVLSLVKQNNMNYGKIICKTELVDCIYMTEEFIEYIKINYPEEYKLGIYKVGRYAWILKNTKKLNTKIPAKGKLNIWTYNKK